MELSGHIATKNDTQRLEIVQKILSISGHFGTNIYAWRLAIVQSSPFLIFWYKLFPNIY